MVSATEVDLTMQVPMNIWKLERAIKELPWYSFLRRWQLQDKLANMRAEAAIAGFRMAIKDLHEAGILEVK
jgi:hypothetical protein